MESSRLASFLLAERLFNSEVIRRDSAILLFLSLYRFTNLLGVVIAQPHTYNLRFEVVWFLYAAGCLS